MHIELEVEEIIHQLLHVFEVSEHTALDGMAEDRGFGLLSRVLLVTLLVLRGNRITRKPDVLERRSATQKKYSK